ncbi:MAG: TRAM domain-containing protein, partial [Cellulosilyticaceae bacterium]
MNTPVEKNKEYTLTIHDLGSSGEGIGKIEDFVVFVPNALIGDTVRIKMLKVKKNLGYG